MPLYQHGTKASPEHKAFLPGGPGGERRAPRAAPGTRHRLPFDMPRLLRPVRDRIARVAAWVATAAVLAWLVGRACTDRWLWSQYLYWVPGWAALAAGTAACLAATALRAGAARGRRAAGRRRWSLAGALLAAWAWTLLVEWRGAAWASRAIAAPATEARLRVLVWNPSLTVMPGFEAMVRAHGADAVLLANPPMRIDWSQLDEYPHRARWGRLLVLSRGPILAWGGTSLGIDADAGPPGPNGRDGDAADDWWARADDPGAAMFVLLDTRASLGRPTVAWLLDLPSNVRLPRIELARAARRRIEEFRGAWRLGSPAGDAEPGDAGAAGHRAGDGFPMPDLIAGDFNIPRGSASLGVIAGAGREGSGARGREGRVYRHAHAQGGAGPAATWPREWPIWAIDHVFVGPGLRATAYRVVDPGAGQHRMQVVDIAAAAR